MKNNDESMVSKILDKGNKFFKLGMKNIKFQMKMQGTDFVVLRPKDNSKWKAVFGGAYSSNPLLENDYDQFSTRLLVNLNEMKDVWNRNRDVVDSISDDGSLQIGDELQFTRRGRTFRFKIISKVAYSEVSDVLFNYTLSSIIETLDMSDNVTED